MYLFPGLQGNTQTMESIRSQPNRPPEVTGIFSIGFRLSECGERSNSRWDTSSSDNIALSRCQKEVQVTTRKALHLSHCGSLELLLPNVTHTLSKCWGETVQRLSAAFLSSTGRTEHWWYPSDSGEFNTGHHAGPDQGAYISAKGTAIKKAKQNKQKCEKRKITKTMPFRKIPRLNTEGIKVCLDLEN